MLDPQSKTYEITLYPCVRVGLGRWVCLPFGFFNAPNISQREKKSSKYMWIAVGLDSYGIVVNNSASCSVAQPCSIGECAN